MKSERTARRLAWAIFIAVALSVVIGAAVEIVAHAVDGFGILTFLFPLAGIFVLSRQPTNRIGWVLLAIGVVIAVGALLAAYALWGLRVHPGSLPGADVAAVLAAPLWAPVIGIMGIYLLLLFPDGRLPSPRWKVVAWLGGVGIVGTVVMIAFHPGRIDSPPLPRVENPLGVDAVGGLGSLLFAFIALIPISILASAASVIRRFRRSEGTLRLQLKWLTAAATAVAGLYAFALALSAFWPREGTGDPLVVSIAQAVAVFSFLLIPIAIAFSVVKYRLYDIDVVINKTVVYGALAAFITLVYVGIVVGIGTVIGQGDRPNLALSILATAVVAVAFQPVRDRVQRFANHLVYGKRATPYEVLSHFGERMASTGATEELLPRMARILAEGTGAARSEVWLRVGQGLLRTASWPVGVEDAPHVLPLEAGEVSVMEDSDRSVPVRHQGELLGALSITKSRGEPVTPAEAKLLEDLASQAGLVLRNVRLIEELRASRQRLVAAQDQERRRIERDIHDGAQQQLVALNVKLGLTKTLLRKDAEKTQGMIDQLQSETQGALETLRDLARGIYPPLLRDQGLVAALDAQARKAAIQVRIEADGVGRYPQEMEAAVYFFALEALQNVAKYANASHAVVRLSASDADFTFEVRDDGDGFDPGRTKAGSGLANMRDRIDALGGSVNIRSTLGGGTTVTGRLPARSTTLDRAMEPVG
ncbi:MAG TPA: GAF domain-containing sensor histidine kinase [Actinomycetota bacterium]